MTATLPSELRDVFARSHHRRARHDRRARPAGRPVGVADLPPGRAVHRRRRGRAGAPSRASRCCSPTARPMVLVQGTAQRGGRAARPARARLRVGGGRPRRRAAAVRRAPRGGALRPQRGARGRPRRRPRAAAAVWDERLDGLDSRAAGLRRPRRLPVRRPAGDRRRTARRRAAAARGCRSACPSSRGRRACTRRARPARARRPRGRARRLEPASRTPCWTTEVGLTVAVTGPTGEIGKPFIARARARTRGRADHRDGAAAVRPGRARLEEGRVPPGRRAGPRLGRRAVRGRRRRRAPRVHHRRRLAARARAINLEGSRNVFEAAVAAGRQRLVYASSRRGLRLPRRQPAPLDRGRPGARHARHPYSAPEGRGRGAARARSLDGARDRRLRLPAVHRRRARGADAASTRSRTCAGATGCRAPCARCSTPCRS